MENKEKNQEKPKKNKKQKPPKQTSIGGQAVIEGVMMRGKSAMATAVRDEEAAAFALIYELSFLPPPC